MMNKERQVMVWIEILVILTVAFYQYGVQKFSNLPETNEIVFDAASRDYSFTFKDLKNIRFGSSKKIPIKGF